MRPRVLVMVVAAIMLGGSQLTLPASAASKGTVGVYYAASLEAINENTIGPAFDARTHYAYQGEGLGSQLIANEIKSHTITPDVVEFADPAVNKTLMGKKNGSYVRWYVTFARTSLVIGFDPRGKFAKLFREVQQGKLAWYKPLLKKGLHFGRTDPNLDPKGYRIIWAFNLAQQLFHLKDFERRVLGPVENPSQIYSEQDLVGYLSTGNLDAAVFYLAEARVAHIPYITLPNRMNLGETKYANLYATQTFKNKQGQTFRGAPILYTITIPSTVTDMKGAVAFVKFVLGRRAEKLSRSLGLLPAKHAIAGERKAVPPGIG